MARTYGFDNLIVVNRHRVSQPRRMRNVKPFTARVKRFTATAPKFSRSFRMFRKRGRTRMRRRFG